MVYSAVNFREKSAREREQLETLNWNDWKEEKRKWKRGWEDEKRKVLNTSWCGKQILSL